MKVKLEQFIMLDPLSLGIQPIFLSKQPLPLPLKDQ